MDFFPANATECVASLILLLPIFCLPFLPVLSSPPPLVGYLPFPFSPPLHAAETGTARAGLPTKLSRTTFGVLLMSPQDFPTTFPQLDGANV